MDIEYFMSEEYEKKINKKMMYYDYVFPTGEVVEYVRGVCDIPIERFVKYIQSMPTPEIEAKDVFQYSSFEDATTRLCERMLEIDNPGLKHIDVGRLLLNDGKSRNDGAYTKYGENHAKLGNSLGLLQELSKTYFLSCIGYVYPYLEEPLKNQILVRLILRNNLIKKIIIETKNGEINMRHFLYMISDSTYKRRIGNVKGVINILIKSREYDFTYITDNSVFACEES